MFFFPTKAILDSGSEINGVSQFIIEKFNKGVKQSGSIIVKGVNSTIKRPLYHNVPVNIFGKELTLDKLAGVNLGGRGLLLGKPFFEKVIVQIDYPKSMIRILPRDSLDMKQYKNVEMRRQKGNSLPVVQVELNGTKAWLTFDTGAAGGLFLKRSFVIDNELIEDPNKLKQTVSAGVNSFSTTDSFVMPNLTIGPFQLEDIPAAMPAEGVKVNVGRRPGRSRGASSARQSKGLLGYEVLKHFIVTIDYERYRLNLSTE
jgi:hypothetical protein